MDKLPDFCPVCDAPRLAIRRITYIVYACLGCAIGYGVGFLMGFIIL